MATPNLAALSAGIVQPIDPPISTQLASGNVTVYTVGSAKAAKLDPLRLKNASTSAAVTVTVSVVPSGGSVDGTHQVGPTVVISAGDSASFDEVKGWYGAGTFVSVNSSAGASIDAVLTGLEFS